MWCAMLMDTKRCVDMLQITSKKHFCLRNQEEHMVNTANNLNCTLMKKKLLYLVFVALAAMTASLLSLTSCSKDADKDEEAASVAELQAKFVGEWKDLGLFDEKGEKTSGAADIRLIFQADGTLITLLNGKEKDREKWKVKVDGDKRYLYMGILKFTILSLNQDVFDVQYFPKVFNRYQRVKTAAPPKK